MKLFLIVLFSGPLLLLGAAEKPATPSVITMQMQKDYWKMVATKAQLETQAAKAAKDLEAYTVKLAQSCEASGEQLVGDPANGDPTCTPKPSIAKPEVKKEK